MAMVLVCVSKHSYKDDERCKRAEPRRGRKNRMGERDKEEQWPRSLEPPSCGEIA